ncbi:MAG: MarR family transcriptional regulator [Micromonosporaceae bacterium]
MPRGGSASFRHSNATRDIQARRRAIQVSSVDVRWPGGGSAQRRSRARQGPVPSAPRSGTPERRSAGLPQPTRKDFENLLAFRVSLRRFQHWSENQARAVGLTHAQHQLLVAIKGHPDGAPPTVSDLAGYLLLRHHSAVELVNRAEAGGFVRRCPDASDGRIVRVQLTNKGDRLVTELTGGHLAELHKLAAVLNNLVP